MARGLPPGPGCEGERGSAGLQHRQSGNPRPVRSTSQGVPVALLTHFKVHYYRLQLPKPLTE